MRYNIITELNKTQTTLNKAAGAGKENKMEEMTDLQFKAIINAVIQIIRDNEDKNDMIEKIEALVNKN